MSKKKASKSQEPSDSAKPAEELSDDELAKVAGGIVGAVTPPDPDTNVVPPAGEVISPRDAASGLPTGKRMHKPYVAT